MAVSASRRLRGSRLLAGCATIAGAFYLLHVWQSPLAPEIDRVRTGYAAQALLYLLIANAFLWRSPTTELSWLAAWAGFVERHATACLAGLVAATYAIAWWTTPQIAFGDGQLGAGYGADGLVYGWMAENFAWSGREAVAPFNARWLAPMLVHYSGLDTFAGFALINAASHVLCCVFVYRIALHYHDSKTVALIGVFFFAASKFGLKFWIHYPVATDGIGAVMMLGAILATLRAHYASYAIALCLAAVCRENVLALIPFFLIHEWRRREQSPGALRRIGLQLLPIGVYLWMSLRPVFAPAAIPEPLGIAGTFSFWLQTLLESPDRAGRVAVAYINSLGLPLLLAVFVWRGSLEFLRRHPEWLYYGLITFGTSVFAGADVDRFAFWQLPMLIAMGAWLAQRRNEDRRGELWLHWIALQAVAGNLVVFWDSGKISYLTRFAVHASSVRDQTGAILPLYEPLVVACTALVVATAAMYAAVRR